MSERRDPDERLTRWLAATSAEPDPALWTRVRARLAAQEQPAGWLGSLAHPAALATSFAALVLASTLSVVLLDRTREDAWLGGQVPGAQTSLTDALLAVGSSPMDGWLAPESEESGAASDSGTTP